MKGENLFLIYLLGIAKWDSEEDSWRGGNRVYGLAQVVAEQILHDDQPDAGGPTQRLGRADILQSQEEDGNWGHQISRNIAPNWEGKRFSNRGVFIYP